MSISPPPPSVEPNGAPLPHPPTQVYPETPRKDRSAAYHSRIQSTPQNPGSGSRMKQEGNTDRKERYAREEYEEYIREDLSSRVFVDFEVFMKSVLHVPADWKTRWRVDIEKVKADPKFREHHGEYCRWCNQNGTREESFYAPLVKIAGAVLEVASQSDELKIAPGNPQHYVVNDPKKLRGGVINRVGLSPDIVVLHDSCEPSEGQRLHWANALHILEVKPYDNALCEGWSVPRLVVDGVDPMLNHAAPNNPARWKPKDLPIDKTYPQSTSSKRKKRAAEESEINDKPQKKSKTMSRIVESVEATDNGTSVAVQESDKVSSTSITETQTQMSPAMQVGYYLLEMFSIPLLRSHATVGLVDRDRLQLYHANRSVILVSSAINFSEEDGLDKFIAVIIAFRLLSFKQNGILDGLVEKNAELAKGKKSSSEDKDIQGGHQLELTNSLGEKFKVTLGDVIARDPATVGRSTVVLRATSDKWRDIKLVVKISWPGFRRVAEDKFVKSAREETKKPGEEWAANHLPKILHTEDVDLGEDSTFKSVAALFEDAQFAEGKNYKYERRVLRVIIQEELNPLKSLTNARDVGQVFADVACIHRWLYDKPGILHRDPSPNNIMFRRIEGQVYGVLTDYDLSSWTRDLQNDYSKTSQQRTGTPPYMAHELLKGTTPIHLYRHDLEALFYVMLLFCGRHIFGTVWDEATKESKVQVVMNKRKLLPYKEWFNEQNYKTLGKHKSSFFLDDEPIVMPEPFKDFTPWMEAIHYYLSEGFKAKISKPTKKPPKWKSNQNGGSVGRGNVNLESCDDETLGGHIKYTTLIDPIPHLEGELEGLIVRYPA